VGFIVPKYGQNSVSRNRLKRSSAMDALDWVIVLLP